jgi:Spy/CpxP family protein refolding chaperone
MEAIAARQNKESTMNNRSNMLVRSALVLLCGAGLAVSSAWAQQDTPPPPPDGQMQGPPHGGPGGHMNPEHRLAMLQKELSLSPDQTAQMKAIFEQQHAKIDALQSADNAQHERRSQMMAIHQESEAQIKALLTPDQQTKYAAMEARMRERRHDGPGAGGPPPPPPPPQ